MFTITHVLICENPRVRIYKHNDSLMKRASAQWRSYLHTNRVHIRMHTYIESKHIFCISHKHTNQHHKPSHMYIYKYRVE